MGKLSDGERNLVGLGAALGSNCVPCVEHYVSEARSAGFTDRQIGDAIRLADGVRRVPAQRVLDAALALVPGNDEPEVSAKAKAERTGADQEHRVASEAEAAATEVASRTACADQKRCGC